MTIPFLWRLLIILRKLFLSFFFIIAIHLHSSDTAEFEVLVTLTVPVSITINNSILFRAFSEAEATYLLVNPENATIGTFILTVTSSTNIDFTVHSYAAPKHVGDSNQFQARSNNKHNSACKLLFYSDKTATGADVSTELINQTIVIRHQSSNPQTTITRNITAYLVAGQILTIQDSRCTMPLFFQVEGA